MKKKLKVSLLVILVVIAVASGSVIAFAGDGSSNATPDENKDGGLTLEESKEIAKNFVENSQTYKFDGFDLDYNENLSAENVDSKGELIFVFEFESKHSGYGDREGKVLLQVITPHKAEITVENGAVTSAVLDSKWNMIEQKMIQKE